MVQDRSIVSAMEKLPMRVLHIVLTVCFNCMAGMLLADALVFFLSTRLANSKCCKVVAPGLKRLRK